MLTWRVNMEQRTMAKTELLLDTSGLLSLFDQGSASHREAADFFTRAQSLMTTNLCSRRVCTADSRSWLEPFKIAQLSTRSGFAAAPGTCLG